MYNYCPTIAEKDFYIRDLTFPVMLFVFCIQQINKHTQIKYVKTETLCCFPNVCSHHIKKGCVFFTGITDAYKVPSTQFTVLFLLRARVIALKDFPEKKPSLKSPYGLINFHEQVLNAKSGQMYYNTVTLYDYVVKFFKQYIINLSGL